jgi:hypothetical protein
MTQIFCFVHFVNSALFRMIIKIKVGWANVCIHNAPPTTKVLIQMVKLIQKLQRRYTDIMDHPVKMFTCKRTAPNGSETRMETCTLIMPLQAIFF